MTDVVSSPVGLALKVHCLSPIWRSYLVQDAHGCFQDAPLSGPLEARPAQEASYGRNLFSNSCSWPEVSI